jgi:hypothetical protein
MLQHRTSYYSHKNAKNQSKKYEIYWDIPLRIGTMSSMKYSYIYHTCPLYDVEVYPDIYILWMGEKKTSPMENILCYITQKEQYRMIFEIMLDIIQTIMLPVIVGIEKNLDLCNQAIFFRKLYILLKQDMDAKLYIERTHKSFNIRKIKNKICKLLPVNIFLNDFHKNKITNPIHKIDICIYYYLMMRKYIPSNLFDTYTSSDPQYLVFQYVYIILKYKDIIQICNLFINHFK